MEETSLQERYAPSNICFGCGQANPDGLQLKSYVKGDLVVAAWEPASLYEAFPGILNGGIIGTLLDCHSNWTAAYHLMLSMGLNHPPCTVTSYFNVRLMRPTPSKYAVHLRGKVVEIQSDRAKIYSELFSEDTLCASCEGLFVAVKPGHPAYHRW